MSLERALYLNDTPNDKFGIMESLIKANGNYVEPDVAVCQVSVVAGNIQMSFSLKQHELAEVTRALRAMEAAR